MERLEDRIINDIIQKMHAKKEAFIKEKLIEKGYSELVETSHKTRFPKINISKCDGWDFIFADNGTKQGDFIVAIKDFDFIVSDLNNTKNTIDVSFVWQDVNFTPVEIK